MDLHNTLHALRFSHQNITHLPENIGSLSLGEFDLRNNNISSLPESFNNFKNLKLLYLSKNPICTTAPDKVKEIVVKNKGDPDSVGCAKQCGDLWRHNR